MTAMPQSRQPFSIRDFLRDRAALLVHFSTVMTRHNHLYFPDDIRNAMSLRGVPLSFCTILSGDIGPYQGVAFESANSCGSVGMIIDILDDTSVQTVGSSDDGTYYDNKTGTWISGGSTPDSNTCAQSVDARQSSNEWFVKDFKPVGIFVFQPIFVRKTAETELGRIDAEGSISLDEVVAGFPEMRIFSIGGGQFIEYDRERRAWNRVDYAQIIRRG